MSYPVTYADTYADTYTVTDIQTVMRRFTADLMMIAQSSGAMSEDNARSHSHDIELLAVNGYLSKVDITLLSHGVEVRAAQYIVNTDSGNLTMSRPGGVRWPRVFGSELRVVVYYTDGYDAAAREALRSRLWLPWGPSHADTSHAMLTRSGGRDYASKGWGLQRVDFAA
jgi:hypothetical protein